MDLGLAGKTVVLTGASRGIGRAALHAFAAEGASVIAAARPSAELDSAVAEQVALGHDVTAAPCDISSVASVAELFAAAKERSGRIDVLVNNAAGRLPTGHFLSIEDEQWLAGWDQKLQWYIRTAQAVFPIMQAQGGGKIVNVVGTAARNPKASYMAVGISNAGLINFTKALADLGAPHGILAAGVAPSGVLTERYARLIAGRAAGEGKTAEQLMRETVASFPLGRLATPQEVGDVICFIASPRASYISGTVITVDGAATQGVFN